MVALALKTHRQVKRLVIGLIGLGILATEFIWAKSLLRTVKQRFTKNNKGKGGPPKD